MTSRFTRCRSTIGRVAAVILVCGAILTVFFTWQSRDSVIVQSPDGSSAVDLAEVLIKNFNPRGDKSDVVVDLPTLATLAANVYEAPDKYDSSCVADGPGRIHLDGWEQLKGWSYPTACNVGLNGLYYEVWSKMDSEGIGYQAVVFRGTIPSLAHWCSNLRTAPPPVCDPKSDQYLSIAPLIDDVISGIYDEWGPDRYTFAVGHSLGGGLAELAGHSSYISQVFAFNSSPVVGADMARLVDDLHDGSSDSEAVLRGYTEKTGCQFRANNLPNGRRLLVNNVYEYGEVLAYLRLLKRWFIEPWVAAIDVRPPRIDYRTNLIGGGPLSQHSMKALACAMREASPNKALHRSAAGTSGGRR